MRSTLAAICVAMLAGPAAAAERAGLVHVRLETSAGPITLALDARRAPITTANFMAYVDDGRFDGTVFYRAARSKARPGAGFVQGGVRTDLRRALPPIDLEPTSRTGLRHLDATVSMAHGTFDASATGNFVLTVGPSPQMDARPGFTGYAAFGRVTGGMDAVRRILAQPSGGGSGVMRGQMILRPVRIVRAVRLDGVAKPSGRPKVWLILRGS
ncbi:peptidylprolyl isomerase [uncultured Sphingomonas sp.]|uniref:peptidylprolyl isomerase n=1 Tax=uncultured Sphingomonas sp. TaxID=158754 RepID=UPI0035CB1B8D